MAVPNHKNNEPRTSISKRGRGIIAGKFRIHGTVSVMDRDRDTIFKSGYQAILLAHEAIAPMCIDC